MSEDQEIFMEEITPSYRLFQPRRVIAGVVLASPHSGDSYPEDFIESSSLDLPALRSSEDMFVHQLLRPAAQLGLPLLVAEMPRAWCDLNRAPDELDPALIEGLSPRGLTARTRTGLGVIPRVVSGGRAIRAGKIKREAAQARIDFAHTPYHARLSKLIDDIQAAHGQALLLDMHSMPSGAAANGVDIVLGDRFGRAASAEVSEMVAGAFDRAGFRVALNQPFAGGYVSTRHAAPEKGRHVIQVELLRSCYMDEAAQTRGPHFEKVQQRLHDVVHQIAAMWQGKFRIAAE